MKRKLVAVMLSTAMVFGLVACGGESQSGNSETAENETTESGKTESEAT